MNVNIRHIRYVLSVHVQGSVTGAADRLKISQPSLSTGIAYFEAVSGVRMFDRTQRSLKLTTAGQELLPYMIEADRAFRKLEGALKRTKNRRRKTRV